MSDVVRSEPAKTDRVVAPRLLSYYPLLWFRRRLGEVASGSLVRLGSVATKKIALPTTEQLLGTPNPLRALNRKPTPATVANDTVPSLQSVVEKSHEVLGLASTMFPFTIFPDTVVVDRTKVTIIKRNFFWSEDVVSIRIEDVLNATSGVDMFFGSLNVSSRVMNSTDHYQIKFLRKRDATHLKHLIQGYVIAQHNNIDVSRLGRDELTATLCELGNDTRGIPRV